MPPDTLKVFLSFQDSISKHSIVKELDLIPLKEKSEYFLGLSQNYWSNIIIPVIVPFIAFVLGLLLSWVISKIRLSRDLKRKQTFLFSWISLISPKIKNQIDAFMEYGGFLRELKIHDDGLKKYNLHLDKLKLIDPLQLVSIFGTNMKGDIDHKNNLIFHFQNQIDFLELKQKNVFETFDILKESAKEFTESWNYHVKEIDSILHKLIQERGNRNPADPFVLEINRIYNAWVTKKQQGAESMKKNFIDNAIPLCLEQVNIVKDDKIGHELLSTLQMLSHLYKVREDQFNGFAKIFEDSSSSMDDGLQKLQNTTNEMKKLKFKFLLNLK